ncbi:hypothetical protein PACTADRAFT_37980 [Pachysolen tannophilus NRRL Y-2460]|uniref:Enoyl reductase (ER) domain-containing protein n=1 Tax=Pachysolen tannophilus NRRL Y-2460 TaxID=669874 RepID=A0A1E4U2V5_PACTA|nr:hypothetical protein PACTADRAFT_37980 [Pachysolen tannophilus NRRL Y-2460]
MINPSVVLTGIRQVKIEDRPVPSIPDPHFVKIAVKKTGCCHSDVLYFEQFQCGSFVVKKPMVLGHESSGIVVEVGDAVKNLKVGDRVACEPGVPSRYSQEYKRGIYNLCPEMIFAATPPIDGTLCRYYCLPEDFCVKLADNVSLEEGAVFEPLSVAVHSCKLADIKFGDRVVVMGAGTIGLLVAMVAKAFGATEILIIDIIDQKLKFAKETLKVVTHTYNSKNDRNLKPEEILEAQLKAFDNKRATVALDCTGIPPCISAAIQLLEGRGRYIQVGMGPSHINNFPIGAVNEKELMIRGSFRYGPDDYATSALLIAEGKVDVKPLITHRYKFEDVVKAYEALESGEAIKVMVDGPEGPDDN